MGLVWINALNGFSAGLMLFMLSAGLTLIFSVMGVLNFAHAAFYMLGAYVAWAMAGSVGFWPALVLAPVVVALLGALLEHHLLRPVHSRGHVAELLVTFGVGQVISEAVQLIWGRGAVPFEPPAELQGAALTVLQDAAGAWHVFSGAAAEGCNAVGVQCAAFPRTRALMMGISLGMLAVLYGLLKWTRVGLVVQAAQTHPAMVQALGHDLSRVMTGLFALGCGLAGLAGAIGGVTFVTEPTMAASMGSILFVVVVIGGLGSLAGAFWASLLVGAIQTLPVGWTSSPLDWWLAAGGTAPLQGEWLTLWRTPWAQWAPVMPYALLVVVLALRPQGLLGDRHD